MSVQLAVTWYCGCGVRLCGQPHTCTGHPGLNINQANGQA